VNLIITKILLTESLLNSFRISFSVLLGLFPNIWDWSRYDVFLTVHHSIDLFQITNFNEQFLYSIAIYMLHYNPRHVSSSTMHIFRWSNYIITSSGTVTLCNRPYSTPVTDSDGTRCCNYTICPPEYEHNTARNMSRIKV